MIKYSVTDSLSSGDKFGLQPKRGTNIGEHIHDFLHVLIFRLLLVAHHAGQHYGKRIYKDEQENKNLNVLTLHSEGGGNHVLTWLQKKRSQLQRIAENESGMRVSRLNWNLEMVKDDIAGIAISIYFWPWSSGNLIWPPMSLRSAM